MTQRSWCVLALALLAACKSDSSDVAGPPQNLPPLAAGTLVVNRSAGLLTVGQSQRLVARASDDRGAPVEAAVSWSSSAPEKVSVDATGRIEARTIGSAMIFAQSGGIKSAPVLVIVAEPQPGALLVRDDQVLAVGSPIGLGPNDVPGVGTRYEVRLTGVATPPAIGTVVLASENAPVAGKVVSTRNESGVLVVTLAVAPLSQLLERYNINWSIDVSAFLPAASQPLVGPGASNVSHGLAAHPPSTPVAAAILRAISVLDCDASLAPVLADRRVQLAPTLDLRLEVVAEPGHTRQALVGSLKLEGSVSFKLNAGFKVQGKCEVQVHIPIGAGPLAVGVMPFVRFGVGVNFEGQIFVTAGEYSATGKLGVDVEVGWECGGAQADCRSLDRLTPIKDFDEKFKVLEPRSGMRIELQGQVYALVGLDAAFALAFYAKILEAKVGLVQSVDLGFEEDQVLDPTYASKYDLKVEVVVQPGSGLQRVLDLIFGGQGVVTFKGKLSTLLSQSPKGTLTVSKPVASISGGPVDLRVDLTNTDYFLIGYNVVHVELWQKRPNDEDFTKLRTFDVTASNQTIFTHSWQPTIDEFGTNKFAVFVYTQFPVPGLEIADNSIREVDVKCFTAPRIIAARVAAANTCADTWEGTATFDWPGELHIDAAVTWTRDPANPETEAGGVYYIATGQALVRHLGWENKGCTVSQGVYAIGPQASSDYLFVDYKPDPATFEGNGGIADVSTLSCPDGPPIPYPFSWLWFQGAGKLSVNGTVIEGTLRSGEATWQWKFRRP